LEWQLSGHAKINVRCFDCHAVHRQGLRREQAEQQCGACHAQRMEDFAHATHHLQGLTCTTCHMPQPRTAGIGGTGAPGHSFFVGAQTCSACHEEMVHKSHKLDALSEEIERLTQQGSVQHAEQLQAANRQLELGLDLQKSKTVKFSLIALLLGLILGAILQGVAWRAQNGKRSSNKP
jgi:formate-dependent nitrite reductase cytochrome c552 subunit